MDKVFFMSKGQSLATSPETSFSATVVDEATIVTTDPSTTTTCYLPVTVEIWFLETRMAFFR